MAEIGLKGPELKKLLAVTKRTALAFAYNPGDKIENDLFALHRKKAADVLGREARKEGKGSKVTFGTAALEGRVLSLTCETVVPGTAKKLKKFLKGQKCPMNVVILDPSGNVLEEDIEALPDDDLFGDVQDEEDAGNEGVTPDQPPPEATADAPEPDAESQPDENARLKALLTRANDLKAAIANAPEAAQAKLSETFGRAVEALKSSALDEAEDILTKLSDVLAKLVPATPAASETNASPDMDALGKISAALEQRVAALPDGAAKDKLGEAMTKLEGAIGGGGIEAAKKAAAAIKTALDKMGAAAPASTPEDDAQAAIGTLQTAFITARTNLSDIQGTLRGLGNDEVTRIAEAALSDLRLGDAAPLNAAISTYNSAAPEARADAAARLIDEVRGFRASLADNKIIALCETNPFGVAVEITHPLTQALNGVEAAVSV